MGLWYHLVAQKSDIFIILSITTKHNNNFAICESAERCLRQTQCYENRENGSFLTNYLSDETSFNLQHLSNIKKFPRKELFDQLKIDYKDFQQIPANWIKMQEFINSNKKITFLKTHNAMAKVNNYVFTDSINTKGFIYLVRDPRDIVISYSYHTGKNFDDIIEMLMNQNAVLGNSKGKIKTPLSTWDIHIKSWSMLNVPKYFIRYEDLIQNTQKYFIEIANFLKTDLEINFELNVLKR